MATFNTRKARVAAPKSYIHSEASPTATTYNGGAGFVREPKSELFLLAVANFGADTFYEMKTERDLRFRDLVRAVAVQDADWIARFIPWLRNEAFMRTASVVAGVEAAYALVKAGIPGGRGVLSSALQRADEPGEAVAYWLSQYGRKMPKAIKRGIGDAARRLYNEFTLLKYDGERSVRFADVLELTHPKVTLGHALNVVFPPPDEAAAPVAAEDMDAWLAEEQLVRARKAQAWVHWHAALYRHAVDRRHGHDDIQQVVGTGEKVALPMVYANVVLRSKAYEEPAVLFDADALKGAGMNWEDTMSLAGQLPAAAGRKAELWAAQIPSMGYMALLRNLRNFDQAGVSDEVAKKVADRLVDPDEVARSKQFPYRFLSAYRAVQSLRWAWALEIALNLSLANVPELPGRTLVLVDRSGSMFDMPGKDGLTRADQAAIFGTAVALRNIGRTDLVQFGTGSTRVPLQAGESLLRAVDGKFSSMGGTDTERALRNHYVGHDRVIIITDEQADWLTGRGVGSTIPAHVPMYTWNLAGYKHGHSNTEGRHYTFGGLTDSAFKVIPLLERGQSQDWPF